MLFIDPQWYVNQAFTYLATLLLIGCLPARAASPPDARVSLGVFFVLEWVLNGRVWLLAEGIPTDEINPWNGEEDFLLYHPNEKLSFPISWWRIRISMLFIDPQWYVNQAFTYLATLLLIGCLPARAASPPDARVSLGVFFVLEWVLNGRVWLLAEGIPTDEINPWNGEEDFLLYHPNEKLSFPIVVQSSNTCRASAFHCWITHIHTSGHPCFYHKHIMYKIWHGSCFGEFYIPFCGMSQLYNLLPFVDFVIFTRSRYQ